RRRHRRVPRRRRPGRPALSHAGRRRDPRVARLAVSADTLGPLLALPVVLPLTGAAAAPLLARLSARLSMAVSILLLAGSAGVLLAAAPYVFGGHVLVHYFGGWGPVDGHVLGVTFGADSWGLAFALVTAVVGAILLLFMLSEQGDLGPR